MEGGSATKQVQIDFSAEFDRENHFGLKYKFRSVGVAGTGSSLPEQLLSSRKLGDVVDGGKSVLIDVVSIRCPSR